MQRFYTLLFRLARKSQLQPPCWQSKPGSLSNILIQYFFFKVIQNLKIPSILWNWPTKWEVYCFASVLHNPWNNSPSRSLHASVMHICTYYNGPRFQIRDNSEIWIIFKICSKGSFLLLTNTTSPIYHMISCTWSTTIDKRLKTPIMQFSKYPCSQQHASKHELSYMPNRRQSHKHRIYFTVKIHPKTYTT